MIYIHPQYSDMRIYIYILDICRPLEYRYLDCRYKCEISHKTSISYRGQNKLWVVSGCAGRSNPEAQRGPPRDGGRWASELVQERAVRFSVSDIDFTLSAGHHTGSPPPLSWPWLGKGVI
jgi:hypothetical protein